MIGVSFLLIQYSLIEKIALTDKTSSPLKISTPQNQMLENFFVLNPTLAILSLFIVGLSSKNQFSTLLVQSSPTADFLF